VNDVAGLDRADEGDLEQQVDDCANDHRDDHRTVDVALRVSGFSSDLDRLLKALQGEHDPNR
jgi:hypothetical protein